MMKTSAASMPNIYSRIELTKFLPSIKS